MPKNPFLEEEPSVTNPFIEEEVGPSAEDYEKLRQTEKTIKQVQQAIPAMQEAEKQKQAQDPKNWTSEQTKQKVKEEPPQTIEEQAVANLMIEQKKKQENVLVEAANQPPPKPPTINDEYLQRDEVAKQADKEHNQLRGFFEEAFLPSTENKVKASNSVVAGAMKGAARASNVLDFYTEKISKFTGIPKGGAFEFLRDNWDKTARQLSEKGVNNKLLQAIYSGFGQTSVDIPLYMLASKYAGLFAMPGVGAVRGYAEGGSKEALKQTAEGAVDAAFLKGSSLIKNPLAGVPFAGFGAGATTLARGGTAEEAVASGITNAGLAAAGSIENIAGRPQAEVKAKPTPSGEPTPTAPTSPPSERSMVIEPTKVMTRDEANVMVKHRTEAFPQYEHQIVKTPNGYEVHSYEQQKSVVGIETPKEVKPPTVDLENLPEPAVNVDRMKITDKAKQSIQEATDIMKPEIERLSGKRLSHQEVLEKSQKAAILNEAPTREDTLKLEAALLRTRQHLATLAEQGKMTPEFLDTLRVVADTGTDVARQLEARKIDAVPESARLMSEIGKELMDLGHSSEVIAKAAEKVDFNDAKQVTSFYRQFVKPTLKEQLNEFAYINILSSPMTHIVNTTSNLLQLSGLNPATKLATGAVDLIGQNLKGAERGHYISEVPAFYKGAINSSGQAFSEAFKVMQGKSNLERPDITRIPTKAPWIDYATLGLGKYVTRSLEASDVLFRTMLERGEVEALTERSRLKGKELSVKEMAKIEREAKQKAAYYVFRQKPDTTGSVTGQGPVLQAMDKMTNAIYGLRKVPGAEWFIRFVQTPANIAKQGVEYSPLGLATIPGARDKYEQAGKTIVGSMAFALGSYYAMQGKMTWAAPSGKKDKEEFYAAGMQPYSVKIGNRWYSWSKLGPTAYPLAMATALHYHQKESPKALSDSDMEKAFSALTGVAKFFGDQSYVQSLGDLSRTLEGDETQIARFVTSAPTQLIPLSSFQAWVNRLIDPFYRKPEPGLSAQALADRLKEKVMFLSKGIPKRLDLYGEPAKRKDRVLNAVNPFTSRKSDKFSEDIYKMNQEVKQQKNLVEEESEDMKNKLIREGL